MIVQAGEKEFNFVYLRDEDQSVAQAYDAACTPEFYVFDSQRKLRYHGRLDDNHQNPKAVKSHDLKNALDDLTADRPVRTPLIPAMGCSIKRLISGLRRALLETCKRLGFVLRQLDLKAPYLLNCKYITNIVIYWSNYGLRSSPL